jgi:hypothetical protein
MAIIVKKPPSRGGFLVGIDGAGAVSTSPTSCISCYFEHSSPKNDTGAKCKACTRRAGHGGFHAWIDREFGIREPTAQRFMQVASNLKSVTLTDLTPSVLYALAAPHPRRKRSPSVLRTARRDAEAAGPGRRAGQAGGGGGAEFYSEARARMGAAALIAGEFAPGSLVGRVVFLCRGRP